MLVLSRKRNEKVVIGDRVVTIVIVDIRGDKVRLGIDAPPDVSVHREEVFEEHQRLSAEREAEDQEDGGENHGG